MAEILFLLLRTLVVFSCALSICNCLQDAALDNNGNFFTVSSFRYPESEVRPYDTRYIRVDLPPWFSSLNVAIESDVDITAKSISKISKSLLPVICFRDGSPPLPDASTNALQGLELGRFFNGSFERAQDSEIAQQCYPMQKNITLRLTNEQISPGAWYVGLFNGIGATRTQGKMIVRSSAFSFSANISVEGCKTATMWGPFCNQTIYPLSCSRFDNQTATVISCADSFPSSCLTGAETKTYALDVDGIAEQLVIMASNVKVDSNESYLMCYARFEAFASETLHDYAADIHKVPLIVNKPKAGRWYIVISLSGRENRFAQGTNSSSRVCFSINVKVLGCPVGKAGPNCGQQIYILQAVMRRGWLTPFQSYYFPVNDASLSGSSTNFPLEPIVSNFSSIPELDTSTWTYFLMNIPQGGSGGHIHFRLLSDSTIQYEVYLRFGGLPTIDDRDYYYVNRTSASRSMFFSLYNSSKEMVDFYILYAREGTWSFGLRQLIDSNTPAASRGSPTLVSLSLERCPRGCSSYGQCRYAFDANGLTSYSFCSCDRTHGGFDCSIEIVSHQEHIVQSIALIASNAAALLPAYWALRQREYPEWVLFTSSGISSALYHACDVGTWCVLSYNVLQFMDFWLSFMAVVGTFVYLSTAGEAVKRTIHTVVAILTALLALTQATRASNIIIVLAIGSLGLLIGFLVEFVTKYRSYCGSAGFSLNMLDRPRAVKEWFSNLIKTLKKRFRWGFVAAGLVAFTMAAISFKVETSSSYWMWHSIWHFTIYTSSFFFLCSKIAIVNHENLAHNGADNYELTRQDSLSRN
ncbi:NGX6/PGAP6/MYMK [Arabidopsis suecica]|uniref:NGX6/PGAP6/MYMK n=1 Tax=Arabidopsis suecica TaxID=45249 RepID=A0A8T2GAQ9_ARASU|nr:NGX6/PGAP6/MYMK [Arabidopsis suecica]